MNIQAIGYICLLFYLDQEGWWKHYWALCTPSLTHKVLAQLCHVGAFCGCIICVMFEKQGRVVRRTWSSVLCNGACPDEDALLLQVLLDISGKWMLLFQQEVVSNHYTFHFLFYGLILTWSLAQNPHVWIYFLCFLVKAMGLNSCRGKWSLASTATNPKLLVSMHQAVHVLSFPVQQWPYQTSHLWS